MSDFLAHLVSPDRGEISRGEAVMQSLGLELASFVPLAKAS